MSFLSDITNRSQESEWKRYFISNIRAVKMLYDRGINISSFDPRQLTNAEGLVSDFLDMLFGQELTWDSLGVDDEIDYDDNRLKEDHEEFDEDYYYEVCGYSERPHYMINVPLKILQDLSSRLRPRHYKRIMKSLEGVTPGIEPEEIHPDWSLFKEVDWLKDHTGGIIGITLIFVDANPNWGWDYPYFIQEYDGFIHFWDVLHETIKEAKSHEPIRRWSLHPYKAGRYNSPVGINEWKYKGTAHKPGLADNCHQKLAS